MSILDAIKQFDSEDRKGFEFYEVAGVLNTVDESKKSKLEFKYENVAMRLSPNSTDHPWGSYYGPSLTLKDSEGKPIYVPALSDITPEAIEYWENRAHACSNPLLIVRYAGLVWNFKQKIAKKKQDSKLYRLYVDNMLRVCNEDYCCDPVVTANKLERLFSVAKNNKADLQSVKNAYVAFEQRHAENKAVRLWASQFLVMLDIKRVLSVQKSRIWSAGMRSVLRDYQCQMRMVNLILGQFNNKRNYLQDTTIQIRKKTI